MKDSHYINDVRILRQLVTPVLHVAILRHFIDRRPQFVFLLLVSKERSGRGGGGITDTTVKSNSRAQIKPLYSKNNKIRQQFHHHSLTMRMTHCAHIFIVWDFKLFFFSCVSLNSLNVGTSSLIFRCLPSFSNLNCC